MSIASSAPFNGIPWKVARELGRVNIEGTWDEASSWSMNFMVEEHFLLELRLGD